MGWREGPSQSAGHLRLARWLGGLLLAGALGLGLAAAAEAQFGPPATIFGSISDSAGEVPEGLAVHAYVGDTLCSDSRPEYFAKTIHTGEGAARVAVYVVNVVSGDQEDGCGADGAEIRLQVGDRFADETGVWRRGPVQVDITFGSAAPAPIPTFTPTATATSPPTPDPQATAPATATNLPTAATAADATSSEDATSQASGSGNGTPTPGGANGGSDPGGDPDDDDDSDVPASAEDEAEPTLAGGVTTGRTTPAASDDGGFPVWPVVLVLVGLLAVLGGGVGYMMSRTSGSEEPPGED